MKKKKLALLLGLSAVCLAAAPVQAHNGEEHHEEGHHEEEHHEEEHPAALILAPGPVILDDQAAETENPAAETESPAEEQAAGTESPAAEQTVVTENIIGEEDGYGYELWKDRGDTTMTLTGDGTFICEWSNINSALFRRGQKFDCTKTYKELGNISVDYEVDYEPVGNSYLCLYGWTRDPLIEYYIVDSWGTWRPPGGDPIATITVDDAEYDVYRTLREQQPSIDGTATFEQYWSVRKEKRTEGTIDAVAHFDAWEGLGMPMGKFYEASLTVEGYQSEGKAAVLKNDLKVGDTDEAETNVESEMMDETEAVAESETADGEK